MGGDEPGAEFEGDLPGGFLLQYTGAGGPRLRALHAPSPGRGTGQGPAQGADLPLPHEASVAFAHPPRDRGHARAAAPPARVGEKLPLLTAASRWFQVSSFRFQEWFLKPETLILGTYLSRSLAQARRSTARVPAKRPRKESLRSRSRRDPGRTSRRTRKVFLPRRRTW